MINSGIYQIRNIVNQKIYVGSAMNFDRRKSIHFKSLEGDCHHSIKLQNSFNKHEVDDFIFEILEYIEDVTKLIEREQYYFDTLKPDYNICLITGSRLGVLHREESKKKIRETNRITYSNPEIRSKISKSLKGKKFTQEHKDNISSGKLGKPLLKKVGVPVPQEVREKISSTLKGRVISEEVRKNMSQPRSEEHRKNIGLGHIGKRHTDESKKKMSDSKKKTVEEFLEKFDFISDDDLKQSYKFLREKYSLSLTTISKLKKTRI